MSGEKKASAPPTPAIHVPMVSVCADRFMTYASASTSATVTVAHLRRLSVSPYAASARRGDRRSTTIVSSPATSSSVPAAEAQLNLNVSLDGALPLELRTSRPGHEKSYSRPARKSL